MDSGVHNTTVNIARCSDLSSLQIQMRQVFFHSNALNECDVAPTLERNLDN